MSSSEITTRDTTQKGLNVYKFIRLSIHCELINQMRNSLGSHKHLLALFDNNSFYIDMTRSAKNTQFAGKTTDSAWGRHKTARTCFHKDCIVDASDSSPRGFQFDHRRSQCTDLPDSRPLEAGQKYAVSEKLFS